MVEITRETVSAAAHAANDAYVYQMRIIETPLLPSICMDSLESLNESAKSVGKSVNCYDANGNAHYEFEHFGVRFFFVELGGAK